MSLKPHVPLAIGVLVIVLSQALCAWWITHTIERTDNGSTLDQINSGVDDVAAAVRDLRR